MPDDPHATGSRAATRSTYLPLSGVLQTQDAYPLSIENVDRAVQMILEAVDEHR